MSPQHIQKTLLHNWVLEELYWKKTKIIYADLTGTQPESSSSLAGTTHNLDLKTAYYTTTVPIWLDLVSDPSEWASSFLSEEAKEVLEVLGGVVVVFAIPPETASSSPSKDQTEALLKEVGKVVKDGLNGWEWDGVRLAVGVGEVGHLDDLDTWDEICGDAGLEFVHVASVAVSADAKNEFGGKSISDFFSLPYFFFCFCFFHVCFVEKINAHPKVRKAWYPSCSRGIGVEWLVVIFRNIGRWSGFT